MSKKILHKLFEQAVSTYPKNTAIAEENQQISYSALNNTSNQLARLLMALGVTKGEAVGVLLPSGINLVSSLMASFKMGGVYVPMATDFSKAKLTQVLADTKMKVLITDEAHFKILKEKVANVSCTHIIQFTTSGKQLLGDLDLGTDLIGLNEAKCTVLEYKQENYIATKHQLASYNTENLDVEYALEDSSYIFYTSGTTGKSKAIVGSHKAIGHYVNWHATTFNLTPESRISQIASVTFDASLKDILTALISGATLCVPLAKTKENMLLLSSWLAKENITVLQTVPSLFRLIIDGLKQQNIALKAVKEVVLAGEKLYGSDVLSWRSIAGHQARLSNLYGLTETTVLKSCYHIPETNIDAGAVLPVGKAIANTLIAVINKDQICNEGEIGDVYIKSPFITKGYLDTTLNSNLLVQNPLVTDREDLVCRTGDIGRYDSEGNLELLGRVDDQIKLHGVRVDLEGIRSALLRIEGITQVELLLHEDADRQGSLLCYYSGNEIKNDSLRSILGEDLDRAYMPDYFVYLAEFPLTLNGKVDKRALPKPSELLVNKNYEAPEGAIEQSLATIWEEVLRLPEKSIGRNDSFFDLGGSSLKAIQLISRIFKKHEVQLSIGEIFNNGILQDQAALIQGASASNYEAIPQVAEQEHYPLSHAQRRLWVLDQLEDGLTAYSRPISYDIKGTLHIDKLTAAFQSVMHRHESLRTVFSLIEGTPRQFILPSEQVDFSIVIEDISAAKDQETAANDILNTLANTPINLSEGPLFKVTLVQFGAEHYRLLFAIHHIISDEWSMKVLINDLLSYYNEGAVDQDLPIQYKDYAAWQLEELSGNRLEEHRNYWINQFSGTLPVLDLPSDYKRPAVQTYNGAQEFVVFNKENSDGFQSILKDQDSTLFMGVTALVKTLLYRYTGQNDIIIGTPVAGRDHNDLEEQVGIYINNLALRSSVDKDQPFSTLLAQVKETSLSAFEHQVYPFDLLVDELGLARDLSRFPLFDVAVVLHSEDGNSAPSLTLNDVTVSPVRVPVVTSLYDLTFWFKSSKEGVLSVHIEYNTDIYSQKRIQQLGNHLSALLQAVVGQPALAVANLPMMEAKESALLFAQSQGKQLNIQPEDNIVSLFETQVRATPEATALSVENRTYSYAALNDMANSLACYLKTEHDVTKEQIIGVLQDRTEWMLISILGILKAGAAYLPIDKNHPEERIHYMLDDSEVGLVLTDTSTNLPAQVQVCNVIDEQLAIKKYESINKDQTINATQLAYIMYTSGSTGRPKGVMIEHGSVVNLLASIKNEVGITATDNLLAVTTYSFDISVLEFFTPLVSGAQVTIASSAVISDPRKLSALIASSGATIMQATPSMWKLLLDYGWKGNTSLKVLSGGELLSPNVGTQLFEKSKGLWNMYGPTETTIWSTCHHITSTENISAIGTPLQNTSIYIFDDAMQLVPTGVKGNLFIGGIGVARGYKNNPLLTQSKFIKNPLNEEEIIYNTGDLCQWNLNGQLEYLGREDSQIKIHGHRIELGEIENSLEFYQAVDQVVVLYLEEKEALVAYVTGDMKIGAGDLRSYLRKRLPVYMVPSYVVQLDQFPLNTNGKVNKLALPHPEVSQTEEVIVLPQNKEEEVLVALWKDILVVQEVSTTADFFELGGHSLKAIQLILSVHQTLDVEIGLKEIFKHSVLSELAEYIQTSAKRKEEVIPALAVKENYALSHAQRRLWVLEQLETEGSAAYNIPMSYWLQGEIDVELVQIAFENIVARHEILRTNIVAVDGVPYQQIKPVEAISFSIESYDFSGETSPEDSASAYVKKAAFKPFELENELLIRVSLNKVAANKYLLLLNMHHIVTDEWSIKNIVLEFLELYNNLSQGNAVSHAPLQIQYKDYAAWQLELLKAGSINNHKTYWLDQFSGDIPVVDLPTDRPRPAVKTFNSTSIKRQLPTALVNRFNTILAQEKATLFSGLMALTKVLVLKYTGENDIIIGTPSAGRAHSALKDQVGFYVNTLALRTTLDADQGFTEVLANVQSNIIDAFDHEAYPFDVLVEALGLDRNLSRSPLFDIVVGLQNKNQEQYPEMQGVTIEDHVLVNEKSKVDVRLFFIENEEGITLNLEYNTDLFDAARMERFCRHFETVMNSVSNAPQQAISQLSYMAAEEVNQVLTSFNSNELSYDDATTLVSLFETQVKKTPLAIAVITAESVWTYEELNEEANKVAHHLRHTLQIEPQTTVGVMTSRNEWLPIAILGILKARGVYLPIDVASPKERISYILKDSQVNVILSDSNAINTLVHTDASIVAIDDGQMLGRESANNLDLSYTAEDLAYIIYTSGSTGGPKGAMITHANSVNMVQNKKQLFEITSEDRILQFASAAFDASVEEMFKTLCSGASLIMATTETIKDVNLLEEYINEQGVSIMTLPPTYAATMNFSSLSSLRLLVTAGDVADPKLKKRLNNISYFNCYGPTECTVWATAYEVETTTNEEQPLPIGRPIQNTQVYVLDQWQQPVAIGNTGEIYIGGRGVANGYLNRPELTAKRFLANPFGTGKLYRTGDLGRWTADGNLEFIGRADHQVKIRGYRIEIGEIEHTLKSFELIDNAVCVVRKINNDKAIVAYYEAEVALDITTLRAHLGAYLPEYMMPAFFMQVEALPMNTSGKVDKKALPEVFHTATTEAVQPEGEIEHTLLETWKTVLGDISIAAHDNFFNLGGHSLKAIQATSLIYKALEVRIDIKDFFKYPTFEAQAQLLKNAEGTKYEAIARVAEEDYYPLSYAQRRLWLLEQFEDEVEAVYNIPTTYWLKGALNQEALAKAFNFVIERHESLRTRFVQHNGTPYQEIVPANQLEFTIGYTDFSSENNAEEKAQEHALSLALIPFKLDEASLLKAEIIKVEEAKYLFYLCVHHIIFDERSIQVFVKEVLTAYKAIVQGDAPVLSALPIQYKDFAAWQNEQLEGETLARHRDYWLQQFETEVEVLDLPIDHARPPVQTFNGAQVHLALSEELSTQFKSYLQSEGATLYMGLVTLVNALLHRYTGQKDIVVGSPSAGRMHPDVKDQIGFFINTLVLRTKFEDQESFNSLMAKVKEIIINAFEHQVYPFDLLVNELNLERDMSRSPLFDVVVVLESLLDAHEIPAFEGLTVEENQFDVPISKIDLRFYFVENESNISLTLEYNTDIYGKQRMEQLLAHLEQLMSTVIATPNADVGQLNYITEKEQYWLLNEINNEVLTYDTNETLIDVFETQVAQHPDRIALVFGNSEWTYKELNEKVNKLAHHLREAYDIKPGDYVGLMVDRSEWLVISILAILKSGGIYLPIDPSNPEERNNYILNDTGAQILITESLNLFSVSEFQGSLFAIDIEFDTLLTSTSNPVHVNSATDLSYVYYTSGSTGQPKGVLLEHCNGVHMVYNQRKKFEVTTEDCVLQFSSMAFDGSIHELFLALGHGARLLVAKNKVIKDANQLISHLQEKACTIAIMPAAYFAAVGVKELAFLRIAISVGDVASIEQAIKCSEVTRTFNGYGPTECAVWTTTYEVSPNDKLSERLPIGTAIGNAQVYIVDEHLNLVGQGIYGELCIAGGGVARGYLNQAEMTAAKFIDNPFGSGKLYRTGDKAKLLPDGNIDFLGRIDDQVKIRGYRIELNEIDKVMQSHEEIIDTLVTTYKQDQDVSLVVYYTTNTSLSPIEVQSYMRNHVPEYMIPPYMIQMDEFPVNSSGKIDKKKLPEPAITVSSSYVAPRNETEKALVDIWKEVLNKNDIGITDHFFESGGHSLRAIQLLSKIYKKYQVQLNIGEIFNKPLLSEQAVLIGEASQLGYTAIPKVEAQETYALSSTQRRTWLQEQQQEQSRTHNVSSSYHLRGRFDHVAFVSAFHQLVERHESLRTAFVLVDGEPRQEIIEVSALDYTIPVKEFNDDEAKTAYIDAHSERVFELDQAPLFDIAIVKHNEDWHQLLFAMHHIISDEWSMQVMVRDLVTSYNNQVLNEGQELPTLPIQYKDYAAWQLAELSGDNLDAHRNYWLAQFEGEVARLELASDRPRPEVMTHAGAQYYFKLNESLSKGLKMVAQEEGATLFMGVLSLVKALFYKYTGQTDITIGTPVAGRHHPDLEDQIGLYLNTLALRTQLNSEEGFDALLNAVKTTSLNGFDHQVYPLDVLVEDLDANQYKNRAPLFDVVVILQNVQLNLLEGVEMEGLEVAIEGEDLKISKSDLRFQFMDQGDHIDGSIEYSTELYDEDRIARMVTHMENILEAVIASSNTSLQTIEYLDKSEAENTNWFEKNMEVQNQPYLHKQFEAIAAQYESHTAIVEEEQNITYKVLNEKSNQLAHFLTALKLTMGDKVGVLLTSGTPLVSSLLACLKTGITYVPLSTDFSKAKLTQVMTDTEMKVLITNEASFEQLQTKVAALPFTHVVQHSGVAENNKEQYNVLTQQNGDFVAVQNIVFSSYSRENIAIDYVADNSSYIFYTSGTTGKSKAIVGNQQSISQYINWHAKTFKVTPESRISQIAAVTFDASLKDILTAMISGATLCVPSAKTKENMLLLSSWLVSENVSILQTVPSLFRLITDGLKQQSIALNSAQEVVLAGEKLYGSDVLAWRSFSHHKARISNLYGLTETTVLKSCYHVPEGAIEAGAVLPVGKAIDEAMIAVINDSGLSLWGELGEVYIKSPYTTKGYLDAALNKNLLVQNPLVTNRKDLVCRTGDIGRYDNEGNLELLGRIDDQIKLHGVRVDLDGIRGALLTIDGITQVELVLHEDSDHQGSLLCYYSGTEITKEELRNILAKQLDRAYMPDYFVYLDEFPLTLNGKVDKRALPKPSALLSKENYEAPQGGVEASLAGIWQEVLSLPEGSIGRNDSFFDLGGSSLKAIQLISRIFKKHEVQLSIGEIFNNGVLKDQAQLIGGSDVAVYEAIPVVTTQEHYALSQAQRRLWIQETQQDDDVAAYNIFMRFMLRGSLNVELLDQAFKAVIDRHESLRTVFKIVEGEPRQVIVPSKDQLFELGYADLREHLAVENEIAQATNSLAYYKFNLEEGPLLQVQLLHVQAAEYMLLFTTHHIISDEWSMQVFVKEVLSYYNAYINDESISLNPLRIQYKDYAAWQLSQLSGDAMNKHHQYWMKQFEGTLPVLNIPTDHPRPQLQTFNGDELFFEFPKDISLQFKELSKAQDFTLFMGLLAMLKTLLFHYSGQNDIIVGTPVAGRDHADLEDQIGYYLNTLAIRNKVDNQASYLSLAKQVKATTLTAFEHQLYPFNVLVENLNLVKDLSRSPLFDVVMIFQNVEKHKDEELEMNGIEFEPIYDQMKISKSDLRFQFGDMGHCLGGSIEYNTDLFTRARVEQMVEHLTKLMTLIVTNPEQAIQDFDFLTAAERQQEEMATDLFGSDISRDF